MEFIKSNISRTYTIAFVTYPRPAKNIIKIITGRKIHTINALKIRKTVNPSATNPHKIVNDRAQKPTNLMRVLTKSAPTKLSLLPLPPDSRSLLQGENKVCAKRPIEKKLATNQI
ncbi:MAG: hypothetical protein EXS46_03995 [Candidatus Taylorbacteria bacterium]|nr:hypothetical protein [Candidatus Taylorbacteria bacterium]